MEILIMIIKIIISSILICAIIRIIYIAGFNIIYYDKFYFDDVNLEMKKVPLKTFFNKKEHTMKIFDVVKWNKPQNPTEEKDIMVVRDLYGTQAVEVVHLNNNAVSVEMVNNLEYKAHANSIEDAKKKFVK